MKALKIAMILSILLVTSILLGSTETRYTYKGSILSSQGECWGCHCSIYQFMCTYDAFLAHKSTEHVKTIGMPAVWVGRPDSSVTIWRLEGKLPSGEEIIRMPFDLTPFTPAQIEVWSKWIEQGAIERTVSVDDKKSWGEIKQMFDK